MQLRQKTFTLRLINDQRARHSRVQAQVVSIVIPLAMLGLVGGIVMFVRRKKYEIKR
jgi:hypothetical protein